MKNRTSWFFAALAGAAGVYFFIDANESVRNMLGVLTFFVVSLYGQAESDKEELKQSNRFLQDELRDLETRINSIELDDRLNR